MYGEVATDVVAMGKYGVPEQQFGAVIRASHPFPVSVGSFLYSRSRVDLQLYPVLGRDLTRFGVSAPLGWRES